MGMIFDETYRPFFEQVRANGLYDRSFGDGRGSARRRGVSDRQAGRSLFTCSGGSECRCQELFRSAIGRVAAGGRRRFRLRGHARRSPFRGRQTGARGRRAPADRKAFGAVARPTRRVAGDRPPQTGSRQGRLSQAARSGSQKAADARRRRRSLARQQRLLLAAGAQANLGIAVRRMDSRPQSRDVRRRALHQADRFHVPGPTENGDRQRAARAGRPQGRTDLGQLPVAADLRIRLGSRGGLRHPHVVGHARQFSRLRRAGSAVPLRQRRLERPFPQARRRMHGRRQNAVHAQDDDEQSLQRLVSRALGRTQPARLRNRGDRAVRPRAGVRRVRRQCGRSTRSVGRNLAGSVTTI